MPEYLHLLPQEFYAHNSLTVAPSLIGCVINTSRDGFITTARITETEAYPSYDAASHAFGNKRTPRTEIQYASGGKLYIYQIMGLHLMTSIVVGIEGIADVVFIRSVEPLEGIDEMETRRDYAGEDVRKIASGPGMLSVALGITRNDNGILVCKETSDVRIYRDDKYVGELGIGLRINLGVHGKDEIEAQKSVQQPWRYFDKNSRFLSK